MTKKHYHNSVASDLIGKKFYYKPIEGCQIPPFDLNGFRYEKIEEAADMKDGISKHISDILRSAELGEV